MKILIKKLDHLVQSTESSKTLQMESPNEPCASIWREAWTRELLPFPVSCMPWKYAYVSWEKWTDLCSQAFSSTVFLYYLDSSPSSNLIVNHKCPIAKLPSKYQDLYQTVSFGLPFSVDLRLYRKETKSLGLVSTSSHMCTTTVPWDDILQYEPDKKWCEAPLCPLAV